MKIFLIGLPGSGKTTLGKSLADHLKLKFVDLDDVIKASVGKPITQIFEEDGEKFFRNLEHNSLKKVSKVKNFVLATGGGTPCFHNNMTLMNDIGKTVFLDISPESINKRLKKRDLESRPLFKGISAQETTEYLRELKSKRQSFYELSKIIVTEDTCSIQYLLDKIKN